MANSQRDISPQLKIDLENSLSQLELSRHKLRQALQSHHATSQSYEFDVCYKQNQILNKYKQQCLTTPECMETNELPSSNLHSFSKFQSEQNEIAGEQKFQNQNQNYPVNKPDTPTFKAVEVQAQELKSGEILNSENISEGVVYKSKGVGVRKAQSRPQSYDPYLLTEQHQYQQIQNNSSQAEQTINNNINFNKLKIKEEINRIRQELSNRRQVSETITNQINRDFISSQSSDLSHYTSSFVIFDFQDDSNIGNFEDYESNQSSQKVVTEK